MAFTQMSSFVGKPLPHFLVPTFPVFVFFFLVVFLLSPSFCLAVGSVSANGTSFALGIRVITNEANALLKWKASLDNHSQSALSSWAENSPCNRWFGTGCNKFGGIQVINLTSLGLTGMLHNFNLSSFPSLLKLDLSNNSLFGNIPQNHDPERLLTNLDLSQNNLTGPIPSTIGNLGSLTTLSLHHNWLSGSIPLSVGRLRSLTYLALSYNNLTGSIPAPILQLPNLTTLYLGANDLSGSIPQGIGILRALVGLEMAANHLTGPIPASIGELRNLKLLNLSNNRLSGSIPIELGKLGMLNELNLFHNMLSGFIPREMGNLTNLIHLQLHCNSLLGPVPHELGNLTALRVLSLFDNKLYGSIPAQLNKLTHLKTFYLSDNNFTGNLPHDICLGGLLERFNIKNNHFVGSLPSSIKNCTSLARINVGNNSLIGNISRELGVYPNLMRIDMSKNNFNGGLSPKWGQSRRLEYFLISDNNLSGKLPLEIGQARQLVYLDVSSNHLTGEIPVEIGKLTNLQRLFLTNNELSGSIPHEVGKLPMLERLDLATNDLNGFIPVQVGDLSRLIYLNFSSNKLRGSIPHEVGKISSLEFLDLSRNFLVGEIPNELGELKRLQALNLSCNELSGSIPSHFVDLLSLTSINFSYNRLRGPIPNVKPFQVASFDSYKNNSGLCGNATGLEACPFGIRNHPHRSWGKKALVFIVVPLLGLVCLLINIIGIAYYFCHRRSRNIVTSQLNNDEQYKNLFVPWRFDGKKVYEYIIEATEDFDPKFCIGVGGYGAVYKVELYNNQVVAVKKLHAAQDDEVVSSRAFEREVRALTELHHRNIVKLYGFCFGPKHSLLIYEYMERGSLGSILRDDEEAKGLDWIKRTNVIKGVASAVSYMHHECTPPIIHRDISSNNVLLNSEYEAHVSDFGLARHLMPESSSWSSPLGTFGYGAPELAFTMKADARCDVFSFGVVLVEVLMGRHPGDLISALPFLPSGSSSSASTDEQMLVKEIIDQRVAPPSGQVAEEIVSLLKLAFTCLQANPESRPTMLQVSQQLSVGQRAPLKCSFSRITVADCLEPYS